MTKPIRKLWKNFDWKLKKLVFYFNKIRSVVFDFQFQNCKPNQTELIFLFLFFGLDTTISLHSPKPNPLRNPKTFTLSLSFTFTLILRLHPHPTSCSHFHSHYQKSLHLIIPFPCLHSSTSQTHTINIHSHYLMRLTLLFSLKHTYHLNVHLLQWFEQCDGDHFLLINDHRWQPSLSPCLCDLQFAPSLASARVGDDKPTH